MTSRIREGHRNSYRIILATVTDSNVNPHARGKPCGARLTPAERALLASLTTAWISAGCALASGLKRALCDPMPLAGAHLNINFK